ncbi:MAG: recombinase family protein [Defluviitaleaceae bacterium]|nr:recombinase family protein [Defluviitaleaceae bacterium]
MENEFKIAIYSRKSKFTGKGESTENQIEMCKTYLKSKFLEIYRDEGLYIYEDEGFSGAHINRPEFIKMMQEARVYKFHTIICYRLDRISRNISDFAKLIDELNSLGIAFISIKEQFDTGSPLGRAMMYIASVFSQLERETISERIKDNMDELAKDGRWLGGVTPTGYQSVKVMENNKYKQILKLIPKEGEIVNLVFEIFQNNRSLVKTADCINKKGFTTKNNKPFTSVSIKGILENPIYMKADIDAYHFLNEMGLQIYADISSFNGKNGIMAYKKTLQKPGKAHQKLEPAKWIISVGQHEGIIKGEKWAEIYNFLNTPIVKNDYALLSGVIKCGLCGSKFNTKKRSDKPDFYYICVKKCGVKNLSGKKADEKVLENLVPFLSVGSQSMDIHSKRALISKFTLSVIWDGISLKMIKGHTLITITLKQ